MNILVTVQTPIAAKRHAVQNQAARAAARPGMPMWLPVSILLCLAVGIGGGYAYMVFSSIRNSMATQHAVQLAAENQAVSQALGGSVQVGYFVTGNVYDHQDGTGNADLSIGVKGSNGSGTLYATEREVNGNWYADKLTFRPDGDLVMIQVQEIKPEPQSALLGQP